MEKYEIKELEEGMFEAVIGEPPDVTKHKIYVPEDYWRELTGGKISKEDTAKRSIAFLLRREPKESILSEFELPLIQKYFRDYEDFIKKESQTMRI